MTKPYEPTQAEIRRRCWMIQFGWTEATRTVRRADDHERRDKYTVPIISSLACYEAIKQHRNDEKAWFEC